MKLYFAPGACSFCPHVVAREAGLALELVKTDLGTKLTASGEDYRLINPKGYVPALQLDSGEVLTEVAAIVQYLADLKPESGLVPAAGSMDRYRLQEWLHFIATEVQKHYGVLFNRTSPPEARAAALERLTQRVDWVATQFAGKSFLLGDQFTAADALFFTILRWSRFVGFDLAQWPAIMGYMERITARPAVQAAIAAEGLKG
jgi:glutathione S-transferase